jgi:hypothetical protein
VEALYAGRRPALAGGAGAWGCGRCGCGRHSTLPDMLAFADRLARRARCFNIIFHSSELLAGGSHTPDAAGVQRFGRRCALSIT